MESAAPVGFISGNGCAGECNITIVAIDTTASTDPSITRCIFSNISGKVATAQVQGSATKQVESAAPSGAISVTVPLLKFTVVFSVR